MKHRCLERAADADAMMQARPWHDPHDPRSNLVDALTNLRHFAASQRLDFDSALRMSHQHQRAEREQDIADEPEPGAIDPAISAYVGVAVVRVPVNQFRTPQPFRFAVVDNISGAFVGKPHRTIASARRKADKLDSEYGAVRYRVQRVREVQGGWAT
jgi:hypothetical protein